MSLKDANSIDLITNPLPGDDCKLVLFIIDDGTTADELQRYQLLKSKLTAYLTYVEGDDFQSTYPGVGFADVLIRVLSVTPPNDAMSEMRAIGPAGEPAKRLRIEFEDYEDFRQRLDRE